MLDTQYVVDTQYVYGMVYGTTDRELVENVEKEINALRDIYFIVDVISVSHAGPNPVGPVDWSAFITCEVASHDPIYEAEIHT